jgi:hypothetical protein
MTDLSNMGDLCCLTKVFADFRLTMKAENKAVVEAVDKLLGQVCDEENGGSLGVLIKVLKEHKRLLCSLNRSCDNDCGRSHKDNDDGDKDMYEEEEKKCNLSLCDCCEDEDCCPSCKVTLVDLLDDFKRLNDSRNLVYAFQKDLTFLLESIFHYYGRKGHRQPCLPQCDEMFRYIMYLIKLCIGEGCCKKAGKKPSVCKVCKPDPNVYPIVIVIFLSLYFGNKLQKYVELYCSCCFNKGQGSCTKSNCENISVSFTKNQFCGLKVSDGQISGTIKSVEIFDSCNECQGVADIAITGTCGSTDDKHTFTGSAAGVVKNEKGLISGTIFGSAIGTFSYSECHASGILCGIVVELKQKDPCTTVRNPYTDAQPGILSIFRLLDKINIEKMIEVLGDGVAGLGKRLLRNDDRPVECQNSYKDHSKKYRKHKSCETHRDNSKLSAFL